MSTFTFQPDFARDASPQPDLHPTAMPYNIDMAYEYIKELGFALKLILLKTRNNAINIIGSNDIS